MRCFEYFLIFNRAQYWEFYQDFPPRQASCNVSQFQMPIPRKTWCRVFSSFRFFFCTFFLVLQNLKCSLIYILEYIWMHCQPGWGTSELAHGLCFWLGKVGVLVEGKEYSFSPQKLAFLELVWPWRTAGAAHVHKPEMYMMINFRSIRVTAIMKHWEGWEKVSHLKKQSISRC